MRGWGRLTLPLWGVAWGGQASIGSREPGPGCVRAGGAVGRAPAWCREGLCVAYPLKDIGLWGQRVQKAYADMGVLDFATIDAEALLDNDALLIHECKHAITGIPDHPAWLFSSERDS